MQQNKKVIIYMQAYNGEKYLRQCIESVLNQSYTNFEFYCIDNASKDSCPQIITEYAQKDNRIIPMLCDDNIGSRFINMMNDWNDDCYFAIIDHDDWWKEKYLEYLVKFLEKGNLDLSVCSTLMYSENQQKYSNTQQIKQSIIIPKDKIPTAYWKFRLILNTRWGCIMKMGILKKLKNKFISIRENKTTWGTDTLHILEYLKHCNQIGILSEPLYVYRVSDINSSSVKIFDKQRFYSIVVMINEYKKFCEETETYNKDTIKLLSGIYLNNLSAYFNMIDLSDLYENEKVIKYIEVFEHNLTIECLTDKSVKELTPEFKDKLLLVIIFILKNGNGKAKGSLEDVLNLLK